MHSLGLLRAAVPAIRLSVLTRPRIAGRRIPIYRSFASALLGLRFSLIQSGIMTFACIRRFFVWPRVWRFRTVVVIHQRVSSLERRICA